MIGKIIANAYQHSSSSDRYNHIENLSYETVIFPVCSVQNNQGCVKLAFTGKIQFTHISVVQAFRTE